MSETKLAYSILEVCRMTGISRTSLYAAIKVGKLRARKYGARTLICAQDLQEFLNSLPTAGS